MNGIVMKKRVTIQAGTVHQVSKNLEGFTECKPAAQASRNMRSTPRWQQRRMVAKVQHEDAKFSERMANWRQAIATSSGGRGGSDCPLWVKMHYQWQQRQAQQHGTLALRSVCATTKATDLKDALLVNRGVAQHLDGGQRLAIVWVYMHELDSEQARRAMYMRQREFDRVFSTAKNKLKLFLQIEDSAA